MNNVKSINNSSQSHATHFTLITCLNIRDVVFQAKQKKWTNRQFYSIINSGITLKKEKTRFA